MQRRHLLRRLLGAALCGPFTPFFIQAEDGSKGRKVPPATLALQPMDYTWQPELSPTGPLLVIVSLPQQMLYVYRNGMRIGRSTISSGKAGHRTPTGVFTILQKRMKHTSSLFRGASMPYMERLTWSGVALHAGDLPGYPASHGCVRLPHEFASKLSSVTHNGTQVIVTNDPSKADRTIGPGLLFAASPPVPVPSGGVVWQTEKSPSGPVSILMSTANGTLFVYRNGMEIGRAPVDGLWGVVGSHVYSALDKVDVQGRRIWLSLSGNGPTAPYFRSLMKNIVIDPVFLASVRALATSGSTLILTDQPVSVSTRSGPGFKILTTMEPP